MGLFALKRFLMKKTEIFHYLWYNIRSENTIALVMIRRRRNFVTELNGHYFGEE